MAVSPGNLNVVEKAENMSATECFQYRSTVLRGQPFGGIPTVLCLNIILWVVSPGRRDEHTSKSLLGRSFHKGCGRSPAVHMDPSRSDGDSLNDCPTQGGPSQWGLGERRLEKQAVCQALLFKGAPGQGPGASLLPPPCWFLQGASRPIVLNMSPAPSFNKLQTSTMCQEAAGWTLGIQN